MEDIENTLQQQNVGPGNERGSGEWPDPDSPPEDVAPGTDPVRRQLMERERGAGAPSSHADEGLKETLNADRIKGGSSSIPADRVPDRPQDR